MRHGILAIALGGGLALSGAAAVLPLHGQDAAGGEALAITVGLDWYEPADEQCTVTPGLTVGVEARTRGPWLLPAGADALFTGGAGLRDRARPLSDPMGTPHPPAVALQALPLLLLPQTTTAATGSSSTAFPAPGTGPSTSP